MYDGENVAKYAVITWQSEPPTGELGTPTVNVTPESVALTYGGKAEGGTMLNSLDNKTWSANVPTATDAGSYQVWYTVKGDGNNTDSAAKSVQAVIAP